MTVDFSDQRTRMVDGQIRATDVTDRAVIAAMGTVPREEFVPDRRRALAYLDEDLALTEAEDGRPARYLMEPSPFGRLLQLAEITPRDFVLDVGSGTGYPAAVLSLLSSSVVALESDEHLAATASATLDRLGYDNVAVVTGALEEGYPSQAPYDVIVVEGAIEQVPDALLAQIRDGGRLVAIVGEGNAGEATLFRKENGLVSSRRAFNAAVRGLVEFGRQPVFEF